MIKATKPTRVQYRRADAVNYYLQEINNGRLRFSDVRKQMTQERIDNDEIAVVVKLIDKKLQRQAVLKMNRKNGKTNILIGWILIGLSLGITFYSVMSTSNVHYIVYGPGVAGIILIARGNAMMHKSTSRR